MPDRLDNIEDIFRQVSARYPNVRPEWARSIMQAESAGNPFAQSPAGAQGLFQLMPGTARDMGVTDPFDPMQSAEGGFKYLDTLSRQFGGDERAATAAYNAGPGNVRAWMKRGWTSDQPPPITKRSGSETRNYLSRVGKGMGGAFSRSVAQGQQQLGPGQGGAQGPMTEPQSGDPFADALADPYGPYYGDPNMQMVRMSMPGAEFEVHKAMHDYMFGPKGQQQVDPNAIMSQQAGYMDQMWPAPEKPAPVSNKRKGWALAGDVLSGVGKAYQSLHPRPGQVPVQPSHYTGDIAEEEKADTMRWEQEMKSRGLIGAQMGMSALQGELNRQSEDERSQRQAGVGLLGHMIDANARSNYASNRTTGADVENYIPGIARILAPGGADPTPATEAAALQAATQMVGPEKAQGLVAMSHGYFKDPVIRSQIDFRNASANRMGTLDETAKYNLSRFQANAAKFNLAIPDDKMFEYYQKAQAQAAAVIPIVDKLTLPADQKLKLIQDEAMKALSQFAAADSGGRVTPEQLMGGEGGAATGPQAGWSDNRKRFEELMHTDPQTYQRIRGIIQQIGGDPDNPTDLNLKVALLTAKRDDLKGAAHASQ